MSEERFDLEPEARPPAPSRAVRLLSNLGWVLGGALLTVLLVVDPLGFHPVDTWLHDLVGHGRGGGEEPADANLWTCGMHPEVILEEPGQCPICGMDLVPIGAGEADHDEASHAAAVASEWTCELHPRIVESAPGECPIDGRPLVPVEPQAAGGTPGEGGAGREILYYRHPHDPGVVSDVPAKDAMGMEFIPVYADAAPARDGATVVIDPAVVQNMNVITAPVEIRDLSREIRTVGYLDYDQQKMVSVTTKYNGFIERVYVNYIGEPVARGQALFEIYSPELVQTQEELLSALSFARRLETAPPEARRRAEALAEAARTRLGFWDIGADQIATVEESGRAVRTLTVRSPAAGVVMMRMAGLEGMAVKPGMELFHIADLSTLWLSVEIFEDQLPWLEIDSTAEISLSYFPGEVFRGQVRFVEPQLDEKTRTVGLRIEVPNPLGPAARRDVRHRALPAGGGPRHDRRALHRPHPDRRAQPGDRGAGRRPIHPAGGDGGCPGGTLRADPRRSRAGGADRHLGAVPVRLGEQPARGDPEADLRQARGGGRPRRGDRRRH